MNQQEQIDTVTEFCDRIRDDTIDKIKDGRIPEYWGVLELKEFAVIKLRDGYTRISPMVRRKFTQDIEKNKL